VSYALFEERRLDPNLGVMVNPDSRTTRSRGPRIVPRSRPCVRRGERLEQRRHDGARRAADDPTAAAIANAVANAIGRVRSLPITPDKVLAALEGKK
jgi:hypothetical protein